LNGISDLSRGEALLRHRGALLDLCGALLGQVLGQLLGQPLGQLLGQLFGAASP
jgi:hypothetical protein